jgi:hypothetical protein
MWLWKSLRNDGERAKKTDVENLRLDLASGRQEYGALFARSVPQPAQNQKAAKVFCLALNSPHLHHCLFVKLERAGQIMCLTFK